MHGPFFQFYESSFRAVRFSPSRMGSSSSDAGDVESPPVGDDARAPNISIAFISPGMDSPDDEH